MTKTSIKHHASISEDNSWSNKDNAAFYENISKEANRENSILGGLEEGCDLTLAHNYLVNANSILEIGAGYGRVLYCLKQRKYKATITAVERSQKLCKILKERFFNTIEIIECDIKNFTTNKQYDAILWLFSGISDFTQEEQLYVLKKIALLLTRKGVIILDTFSPDLKPANALHAKAQSYLIHLENNKLHGYIPSREEIIEYAQKLNITLLECIPYETDTQSKRYLYILGKIEL
jgi:SAM-dependent methyltransferase